MHGPKREKSLLQTTCMCMFQCICVCMMYVFQCIWVYICMYCMYRVCMLRLTSLGFLNTCNMHNICTICTRHAQDIKAHICNAYTYIPHMDWPPCYMCMYAVCIAKYSTHIPNTYVQNFACICMYGMFLHVYACICMSVPKYACCRQQRMTRALVGATGGQHHGECRCGSSPCSADSIPNEVMMIFIFSKRRQRPPLPP